MSGRVLQNCGWRFLFMLAAGVMSAIAIAAQDNPSVASGIEVIKLHYEKQVRFPRNFDPSVIPSGPGLPIQLREHRRPRRPTHRMQPALPRARKAPRP